MTTITVHCRLCGREFTPTQYDYRIGLWPTCPDCRVDGAPTSPPNREPFEATKEV